MSKRLYYQRANVLNKLHDQLIAAGIVPEVMEGRDDEIWVTVPDAQDEPAVAAVVAAHDAVAVAAVIEAEKTAAVGDYAAAKAAVANLQTYIDLASPTAGQTTAAVKLLAQVAIVLIKRALKA